MSYVNTSTGNDERPAYIQFYEHPIEDREATLREGRYVPKVQIMVRVTPPGSQGSNLTVEKIASEWIEQKKERRDRFAGFYADALREWTEGREIPTHGTGVRMWPAIGPTQVEQLLSANVKTVEDLAGANESTLQKIGMGAMALKQRADAWLKSANDTGKVSEELASLRTRLETLEENLKDKDQTIKELQSELDTVKPRKKREPATDH